MSEKIASDKFFFEEDFIETTGKVSTNEYKTLKLNQDLKYIGKKVRRVDGLVKVTGKAKYTYDIILPRMCHGYILRSKYANAIINKIDIKKALKLDGVKYILYKDNTPDINWYSISKLFDRHLRHEGDEIACIVAENLNIAIEASKLIEIDYKILDTSYKSEKSSNPKTVKIHEDSNLVKGSPSSYSRGDFNKAFENSEVKIEKQFHTEIVVHNPTEVHCSVANWSGNKLTIYDSTQSVFGVRSRVARALNIDESDVRIIKEYMGGGFGGKLEAGKYSIMASLISKKLNRPIKIVADRKDMNTCMGNRPDSIQNYKVGCKKNGELTAINLNGEYSIGAYPANGFSSWPLRQIYKCQNILINEKNYYTNTGRARAFRAPGHVQGTFALESIIDEISDKIGMDPLEFRLKNYAEKDQVWNLEYTSKLLKEAYKAGAKEIGWNNRNKLNSSDNKFLKRGIGMATQIWWGGGGAPAHVTLQLSRDGSVLVQAGSQDLGTGTYTFISQVVAEILEMDISKVTVVLGDTDKVPYGPGSGGSTTAPSISPACRDAAEKMKALLISGAASMLNVKEDEIIYQNEELFHKGSNKKIKVYDILKKMNERVLTVTGNREKNPDGLLVQTFGAQFAEVEVNILTGNIKVIRIVAAHDIGRVLNRQTLENQFHGGIIQGIGMALMEEQIVDESTSKVLNPNLHDYKMPTIFETPEIKVLIMGDGDNKANNMGVKGIGEPAIVPTPAAIANAVCNAIGKRIYSLPITPDKVLKAIYGNEV